MKIWGKPLLSVNDKGDVTNVLIIDTEGICKENENESKKIVSLALLLSNVLIFNSQGNLKKEAV